jgi:twitching motility two-component system response regulator PilH
MARRIDPRKSDAKNNGQKLRRIPERNRQTLVAEQAAAYGVSVPGEPAASERFLSPNEIGKILNVTGEAVKQWIYHRRLPAVKLANGYWKVRVGDFEQFLKARFEVGRRRVMITDSKSSDFTEVTKVVEKLGHQVITAHNYADALLKALDHHPALFIINLSSKDTDPWKLTEKIRGTKALRNAPILLLADSDLSEADAEHALELTAQGFLKRPLDGAMLEQEIQRILERTS